ncbi:MAG: glycosyltransferase, partial [Nitrosopumilus sp.]
MKVIQVNYHREPKISQKLVYLLRGFRELGITSVCSNQLGAEFLVRKKGTKGLTLVELIFEDSRTKFWFDLGASHISYPSVVKDGELYFKIQYHKSCNKHSFIRPIAESVAHVNWYYENLNVLRQEKLKENYKYEVMGLFRKVSMSSRLHCVERVLKQKNWNSYVTVYDNKSLFLSNAGVKKLPYVEHLKLQVHSKICLSIADKACRCFRDTEVLGFGGCLLVFGLSDDYPDFLHDKSCWISIKKDFSDFVEKVNYYLQHDEERE